VTDAPIDEQIDEQIDGQIDELDPAGSTEVERAGVGPGTVASIDEVVHDPERCYRILLSRDARFDGWFFVGVRTTGIFCRPSCPATTPKRANVGFYRTAAAAQQAGFRACRRCRPDTAPGSPEWNVRADLAGRAMQLVNDGTVDREGVAGLARRLAVSERHLHRVLVAELGAGPLALARARRAHTARVLIETTTLPFTEVAFAAGFASIRQFNDTVRDTFGAAPTVLRADRGTSLRRGRSGPAPAGGDAGVGGATPVGLRLATRGPFAGPELIAFLGARAVPGVEAVDPDGTYRRVLALPHGSAVVALSPAPDHVGARLVLGDVRDLSPAVERCRRLLDLDADPIAVAELLADDPVLEPLVAKAPGRRSPGAVDGAEMLVRAVVGQQISVARARTLLGRLAAAHGEPLPAPLGGSPVAVGAVGALTAAFPTAARLAALDPADLPMPRSRGRALVAAMVAVADGQLALDPGADRAATEAALVASSGIGPWTASYVAMRALGDPDVFLPTDVGVRHALDALGRPSDPAAAAALAASWRPWRSYALHHLWASLG
jgi:AraC family transcriptional regulator of adaptative response / DNA-3-methyladenine glycosylase II